MTIRMLSQGSGEIGDKELSAHQHKVIVIAFILIILIIVIILSHNNLRLAMPAMWKYWDQMITYFWFLQNLKRAALTQLGVTLNNWCWLSLAQCSALIKVAVEHQTPLGELPSFLKLTVTPAPTLAMSMHFVREEKNLHDSFNGCQNVRRAYCDMGRHKKWK